MPQTLSTRNRRTAFPDTHYRPGDEPRAISVRHPALREQEPCGAEDHPPPARFAQSPQTSEGRPEAVSIAQRSADGPLLGAGIRYLGLEHIE